jgi:hypothetical protein
MQVWHVGSPLVTEVHLYEGQILEEIPDNEGA